MGTRLRRGAATAAAVLVCAGLALASPAGARGAPPPDPLVDGLAGPLAIDVTVRGDVIVGQSFAGLVSRVSRHGTITDLVSEPGAAAVDELLGHVFFTVAGEDGSSLLEVRDPRGRVRTVADLGAHEARRNPDQVNTYGIRGLAPACAAQWPEDELGPVEYSGIVESNPYAIAATFFGTFVADAAANAILHVDHLTGRVRTVAVLPTQPLTLPADVEPLGLPDCVAGLTYHFEPVPTDVEWHRGKLLVSTLPGGPEDPSLGARGSVYRVDPLRGTSERLATGFFAATDLAVSPSGSIFVAELFGGRVSRVSGGGPVAVAALDTPVAVEWAHGRLYVAYDAFGSGKITTIRV